MSLEHASNPLALKQDGFELPILFPLKLLAHLDDGPVVAVERGEAFERANHVGAVAAVELVRELLGGGGGEEIPADRIGRPRAEQVASI